MGSSSSQPASTTAKSTTPPTTTTKPSTSVSMTQTLRWARQQHGPRTALIDVKSGREWTWEQVGARVERIASGLVSGQAKVRPGDRVALLALNSDSYFEAMYAIMHAGGVVVPVNFRLAPDEILHVLSDSAVVALAIDEAMAQSSWPGLTKLGLPKSLRAVYHLGPKFTSVPALAQNVSTDELASSFQPIPDAGRGGDDVACIFYTGGTTGKSKGVMLTHLNFMMNSMGTLRAHGNYDHTTRFLHVAPMFHLATAQHLAMAPIAASTNIILQKFVPEEILPAVNKYGVTKLVLVSVMVQMVLQQPDVEKQCAAIASREIEFIYGGSPMPKPTMERLLQVLPKARLFQGFGMTETASGLCVLKHEDHFVDGGRLMASVGRPVPWVELKICDEDGKEVPRGTFGEILVRGGNVMAGYYGPALAELTAETLRGGFMHTGDGGYMDKDGYVFLTDRIKDMIKTGGENVFSAEVEKAIAGMPQVQMVCVVGVPDDRLGEAVAAVIVPKQKGVVVTVDDVKAFCQGKLAGYKIPRRVEMKEALPVSGAGKILKHVVRAELKATAATAKAKL